MTLYRYTSNGEGVWSAGKRSLPSELVDEANENRKWLVKPNLPEGDYSFYLTEKGKEMYEKTLLKTHRKYLTNIRLETVSLEDLIHFGNLVYQNNLQVVIQKKRI